VRLKRAAGGTLYRLHTHAEVAALPVPQADALLALAESKSLSKRELRIYRFCGDSSIEHYTPLHVIPAVRLALGRIELDPASSTKAQENILADRFFTIDDDGLRQDWISDAVFLNPPYRMPDVHNFVSKLVSEYEYGRVKSAILLAHNHTDTKWFQLAASRSAAICFTAGRLNFLNNGTEAKGAAIQGQAFFYFGKLPERFYHAFRDIGWFVRWSPHPERGR
jgi:phage N-6-adenine-methyltransferase